MNLFVEKQAPDEYDPDYLLAALPNPATYRTPGQLVVIQRFVEAVADSFRSNTALKQHILFLGTRDGGHLAEQALKHWPPRGTWRTQLHIVADVSNDALGYERLETIEERFKGRDQVHIYDKNGIAGDSKGDDEVDDDDEKEDNNAGRRRLNNDEFNLLSLNMVQNEDGNIDEDIIIPLMHVDGETMASQLQILHSAKPLLLANTIVAITLEHSPDFNVYTIMEFFNTVRYKLFFLGKRQIARIDHLCDEILDDVIRHPSITPQNSTTFADFLKYIGLLERPEKEKKDQQWQKYPPFFVAMPRARRNKEEMTIQHMYDLFGGYDSAGHVQTAADRQ